MNSDELASLKVGDSVGITGRYSDSVRIGVVERLTAAQIIVRVGTDYKNEPFFERFSRRNGTEIGGTGRWFRNSLITADSAREQLEEIKRRRLHADTIQSIVKSDLRSLMTEQLQAVLALINQYHNENEQAAKNGGAA